MSRPANSLFPGIIQLQSFCSRRDPAEYSHRSVVRLPPVSFHLDDQVFIGVEGHPVVESLLIISMASLDFAIVLRSSWPNELMSNAQLLTEDIQRMCSSVFSGVSEFRAVVSLYGFRGITVVVDRHPYEFDGGIAALFPERVYESFSGSFIYHGVLIETVRNSAFVTCLRDIFDIHLPLYAQPVRSVVMTVVCSFPGL